MQRELVFESEGARCAAWHVAGTGAEFAGPVGRPCVVMAPGLAATRDCGFDRYAARLAAAGLDVLLFDFRNFGASGGTPRQLVDLRGQRADFLAAIACARALEGVDPTRVVLWGHSLAGGHVLRVGAEAAGVAAVIALTPAADAVASLGLAVASNGARTMTGVLGAAVRDGIAGLRGRPPVLIPVVGPERSTAVFTSAHARRGYAVTAGPTRRNEVAARLVLTVPWYRPIRHAHRLSCPVLVQIADEDTMASPAAAAAAAWRARADVRHYPCDHLDVLGGQAWFEPAVRHQIHFLRRHLTTGVTGDEQVEVAG